MQSRKLIIKEIQKIKKKNIHVIINKIKYKQFSFIIGSLQKRKFEDFSKYPLICFTDKMKYENEEYYYLIIIILFFFRFFPQINIYFKPLLK